MNNTEDLKRSIFATLSNVEKAFPSLEPRSLKMFNKVGNAVLDNQQAKWFSLENPNIVVSINDDDSIQLSIVKHDEESENKKITDTVKKNIKDLAGKNQIKLDIVTGTEIDHRDTQFVDQAKIELEKQKMEGISESKLGKMYGSRKISRQTLENVRIMVKHSKPIMEEKPGVRSRNIQEIFLECNGERFRFPHNHLGGARAMARHLTYNGAMTDNVGSYIIENTGYLVKLNTFARYVVSNNLINESTQDAIGTIQESIDSIKRNLKRLSGSKTYESVKSKIENNVIVETDSSKVDSLKDMFTIRRFDEKFEEVLPIVNKILKEKESYLSRIEEAVSKPIIIKYVESTAPILEFSSTSAKLAYKVGELATRIVENEELVEYLSKISSRLSKNGVLNEFEKNIISSTVKNVCLETVVKKQTSIPELSILESRFNRYTYNIFQ